MNNKYLITYVYTKDIMTENPHTVNITKGVIFYG